LGLGDTNDRGDEPGEMGDDLPAVDVGVRRFVKSVALGTAHTCAILDDDSLKCWGYNRYGTLGLGDAEHRGNEPGEMGELLPTVNLGTGRTVKAVAAGSSSCAILDDDSLKCWGNSDYGQLGQGDGEVRGDEAGEMGDNLPTVDLGTGRWARAISAGNSRYCAIVADGAIKCWGFNGFGQLGLGDTNDRGDQPNEVGDFLPTVALGSRRAMATGGPLYVAAVFDDGSVRAWGRNTWGELGLGDTQNRGDQPNEMGPSLPVVDLGSGRFARLIAQGGAHVCALLDDDSVKCWGRNEDGGLGLGDTETRGDEPGEMGDALPVVDLGF
jgi:alpha-tubulin suppressor-like RCC1 family protein